MIPADAYVKVIAGEKTSLWPLMEYLDVRAIKYGFNSYEKLKESGCSLDIPEQLYNEKGEPYIIQENDQEILL